jgi:peptidyl-prolyl cis-trans isomerase D
MLQFIRGAVGTWIVKILFAILIASFAIWGIGDIFRSHGPTTTVAEIGPVKIPASELDREFQQQVNRLRQMFGGQFDVEEAKKRGLVDQVLGQLVQGALLDLAARDVGLLVGDALVQHRIQQIPGYRNGQGQFDSELLLRQLASSGLSEGAFDEMIRKETSRELVIGAVTAGALAPEPLVDALYRYRQERRVAETLTLTNDAMPDPAVPDDAELTRTHEDKAVAFTAPEYRTLTVGTITLDALAKTIDLTEDEIKTAYDARADEFQLPERRRYQQVLVDSEEKARKIVDAARAAKNDLAAAAKAEGAMMAELGPSAETEVPEIGVSVFAIEPDTIPDPFKSDLGWHVIKVTKIEPATVRKLDEVRADVEEQLRKDRAADAMPTLVNRIEDALAGGSTLEEAAARFKFTLTRLDAVDATGTRPDGGKVADLPDLAAILPIAFDLAQGAHSPVTEGADNNSFVVRVDGLTPSRVKPLAEVRDQVIAVWKTEQRAREAVDKATEIENQLKAGAGIEEVAKATGATLATTEPLTREPGRAPKLPADLIKALFTLAPGGVAKGATADGQMVARLKEILPADPHAAAAPLTTVRDAAREGLANDLLEEFADALRTQYPVRINRDRIQAMFATN